MKSLLVLLSAIGANWAWSAPVVLDLTRGHSQEVVEKAGLPLRPIASGMYQRFLFEQTQVEVRLPAGRTVQQTVNTGFIEEYFVG